MCGFLTSSILLIDEVDNYTGVILRTACFDLNCPLFTCLDFWHRLSSIKLSLGNLLDMWPKYGHLSNLVEIMEFLSFGVARKHMNTQDGPSL